MKESHILYTAEREQRKGAVWIIRLIWFIVCTLASIGAFIAGRLW